MSIEYVEGTISPGALVCVIRVLSDDSLDFTSIKIEIIRRNTNNNFTIPVARSGLYRVIAFDLENNSNVLAPRIPISIAADTETTFVSNGKYGLSVLGLHVMCTLYMHMTIIWFTQFLRIVQ